MKDMPNLAYLGLIYVSTPPIYLGSTNILFHPANINILHHFEDCCYGTNNLTHVNGFVDIKDIPLF